MIPKIIHGFWGGPDMPDKFAMYRARWQDLHPEWRCILWTPDRMPPLQNQDLYDRAAQISREPWQFRADVLRYEVLYTFGGVWVDMDFEPVQPLDALMGPSAWAAWEETNKWVSNAIMAAEPLHPFIADLIENLPGSAHLPGGNTVKSGPQFITPYALDHGIDIYPRDYFYPFLWNELGKRGKVKGVYATHHFWNRTKRLPDKGGIT